MRYIIICILIFITYGCVCKINPINKEENEVINQDKGFKINFKNNLVVYKFLHLWSYGFDIEEKQFWSAGEFNNEFAIRISNYPFDSIVKSIKTFDKSNIRTGGFDLAFINECKDTIYSSANLKEWIIKENGKYEYYTYPNKPNKQTDTIFIKEIKKSDPFFNDWNCGNIR